MAKIREVMGLAHVSSTARLAYLWIYWTARQGISHATSAELAERLGVGGLRLSHVARELEAANLVRRERTGAKGKGRTRWILLPGMIAAFSIATPQPISTADASPAFQGCTLIDTQQESRAESGDQWR